jgi:hypothetical protein
MLLLRTEKLPEGPDWAYEILCGGPHKISSVVSGIMWRWGCCVAKEGTPTLSAPHNFRLEALQELHQCYIFFPVLWRNSPPDLASCERLSLHFQIHFRINICGVERNMA